MTTTPIYRERMTKFHETMEAVGARLVRIVKDPPYSELRLYLIHSQIVIFQILDDGSTFAYYQGKSQTWDGMQKELETL